MYELIQLTEHDYYIDCPAKIGVVRTGERDVVAIDSGSDKDAAKKVLRVLEGQGWQLKAVYNTHSHADHTGGNRLLQDRTGCAIYARGIERDVAAHPLLEPAGLYGGNPFGALKHKFLMAQESRVEPLSEESLAEGLSLIELPGHSYEMVGFLTADGTAYVADCVSSEETLAKYGIGYLWDVQASLDTLERVSTLPAKRFVPAHAPVCEQIQTLAQVNIQAIQTAKERIVSACGEGAEFDTVLKRVFDAYGLVMSAQQYVLIGSTVRSYLSHLLEKGRVEYRFEENRMIWSQTKTD